MFFAASGKIGEGGRRKLAPRDAIAIAAEEQRERERVVRWLAWASFVYRCMPYTWHRPPTRPIDLPGDRAIHATLKASSRKVQAGRKPSNAEFEVVAIFGSWLTEVLRAENENQGNAEVVLRAIGVMERVDPNDTRAREMRAWLTEVSGWELPDEVLWDDRDWLTAASFQLARNTDTMPTWLREGGRPPGFDPAAFAAEEGE